MTKKAKFLDRGTNGRKEKRPERNNKFCKSFWLDADGFNNRGTPQKKVFKVSASEDEDKKYQSKLIKSVIIFQLRSDGWIRRCCSRKPDKNELNGVECLNKWRERQWRKFYEWKHFNLPEIASTSRELLSLPCSSHYRCACRQRESAFLFLSEKWFKSEVSCD